MEPTSVGSETSQGTGVHRIEFEVDWVPGHVAAYLLDSPEPVLIDAGMPGSEYEATLRDALAAVDLVPADIRHVVLTHPHVDHVGLAGYLREVGNPTIYAPASWGDREGERTGEGGSTNGAGDDPSGPRSDGQSTVDQGDQMDRSHYSTATPKCVREAGVPRSMVDSVVADVRESRDRVRDAFDPSGVDRWIADGEQFSVGPYDLTALATPGHQRDHLAYLLEDGSDDGAGRMLFSGDVGIPTFRAPVLHAIFRPAQHDGVSAYYTALDRLREIRVDRVYPGHGPVHDDLDGALDVASDGLERLCDGTESALEQSGTSAVDAAMERTADITDGVWVPEAVAALAFLEQEGRAESYLDDGVRYYRPVS